MRCPASEKLEIIRLVEGSRLLGFGKVPGSSDAAIALPMTSAAARRGAPSVVQVARLSALR